jgi:hypothetical protein
MGAANMKLDTIFYAKLIMKFATIGAITIALNPQEVLAAPTADVAKLCLHYAYIVYPYKRPGAVPMSGDRQAYFKDCVAKNGEVAKPEWHKP